MAWNNATRALPAPIPIPLDQLYGPQPRRLPPPPDTPHLADRKVGGNGRIRWAGRPLYLGQAMAGQTIHIIHTPTHVEIYDHDGVEYARIPWPQPEHPHAIPASRHPFRSQPLSQKS